MEKQFDIFTSVRARMLVYVIFVYSIFAAVSIIVDIQFENQRVEQKMQSKIDILRNFTRNAVAEPLWQYNADGVTGVIEALFKDPDVGYISIIDNGNSQKYERSYVGTNDVYRVDRMLYADDIIQTKGMSIGKLKIGITRTNLIQSMYEDMKAKIARGVLTVVLLFFVITMVSMRLTRPIGTLKTTIDKVAAGDFSVRAPLESKDEIGSISDKFNEFVDTLQKQRTEINEQRELLEKQNELLEEMVDIRTEELKTAKEAAESASKAKSAFLANISHELRTPLNVILGYSQLLQMDSSLKEEHRKDLDVINSSGGHLLSLINEVLEISRIESGRMMLNASAFNLHKLIHEIEEMFQVRTREKNLELNVIIDSEVPQYVVQDANKLFQILINLMGNAVKFTNEGSISLHISAMEADSCMLYFEITDTGFGIAEADFENIFNPFKQSEAGLNSGGGTGLGLSICKEFVSLMGGLISVESTLGQGSCFRFSVCAEVSDNNSSDDYDVLASAIHVDEDLSGYKVLVVDDIMQNRMLLVRLLKPLGVVTKEASNGEQALEIFNEWLPDLILMDIRMPGMDGDEAMKWIRKKPEACFTKIIVVTASVLDEERANIMADGLAEGFLKKPVEAGEFYRLFETVSGIPLQWGKKSKEEESEDFRLRAKAWFSSVPLLFKTMILEALDRADFDTVMVQIDEVCTPEDHPIKEYLMCLIQECRYDVLEEIFGD